MRNAWMVLPAVTVLACGGSGAPPETTTRSGFVEGTYDYFANLPGQQVRGMLRVIGDTVLVEPVAEYCRPVTTPDPIYIRYTCTGSGSIEGILLRIDRRNPVQLSKWTAGFRVRRQRQVCVSYEVQAGRRVCVQTSTESYETIESRSGTLQLQRRP